MGVVLYGFFGEGGCLGGGGWVVLLMNWGVVLFWKYLINFGLDIVINKINVNENFSLKG